MKRYATVWVVLFLAGCASEGEVLKQLSMKCVMPTDSVSCFNKLHECRQIADGDTKKLTACAENPLYPDCKQFAEGDQKKTFACVENPTLMLEAKKRSEAQEREQQQKAEQDSRDAQEREQQQKTEEIEAYRNAAEQGNVVAQRKLAAIFYNGQDVPIDFKKAAEWYLKAAKQDDAVAQFNLGVMYTNGQGIPQSYKKAAEWYRKSAEQGNEDSQNNLGVMYYNGQGVPQNYTKAAEWYHKAAGQGNTESLKNLRVAEAAIQAEQQKKEAVQLEKNDESNGYFPMSFEDFQLDAESMPVGKRVKITGFYEVSGELLSLTKVSSIAVPNGYKLPLFAKNSPRDTRKKLLELQNCGYYAVCQRTVLGHVEKCFETYMGRHVKNSTCLAIDDIR